MSNPASSLSEYDAIARTVHYYIDGGRSGRGADMHPAFHAGATMFGFAGSSLVAGPIQHLFDHVDHDVPATNLKARIFSIDIVDTIAAVRLELDHWNGFHYSDFFTLLKIDGSWKIINKVFHSVPEGVPE